MVQLPRMASSLIQRNKVVAKRKGTLAAATVVGAGVVAVAGAPVLLSAAMDGSPCVRDGSGHARLSYQERRSE